MAELSSTSKVSNGVGTGDIKTDGEKVGFDKGVGRGVGNGEAIGVGVRIGTTLGAETASAAGATVALTGVSVACDELVESGTVPSDCAKTKVGRTKKVDIKFPQKIKEIRFLNPRLSCQRTTQIWSQESKEGPSMEQTIKNALMGIFYFYWQKRLFLIR